MICYGVEKNEDGLFLVEHTYDPDYALKTESVFAQCNGYFGVRASFDCRVLSESRGMFVGGFYQKANEDEVTELVNCPDLVEIRLNLQGEWFSLDRCSVLRFDRRLNVDTGELRISAVCELKNGLRVKLESRRFASASDRHLFCQEFAVTPVNRDLESLEFVSGINGQITNGGVSHLRQVECRVFERKFMSWNGRLAQESLRLISGIDIAGGTVRRPPEHVLKRRSIYESDLLSVARDRTVVFSKYSYIETPQIQKDETGEGVERLRRCVSKGYRRLYEEHQESMDAFWKYARIRIEGASLEEQAALCFAQYHLKGMTPADTPAYGVAAKGLTGEGYKGHVFWDTEIFVLPFLLYVFPEQARNLLIFRYNGLPGAREKARQAGYRGAMFPWETAKDGFEETPQYAQLNIHTGKANRVWSGMKECHITADIAYAVWNYETLTQDRDFMTRYGNRMIFEAAAFWVSRAAYVPEKDRYEIADVIGPDEYDEHVDNNAYTNYMARFCVKLAVSTYERLKDGDAPYLQRLERELHLEGQVPAWRDFVRKIYLPGPDRNGIIPQDDSFLSKKELPDLEKYRESKRKQSILLDYSRDEVVEMQVLKQADLVMLFDLLPDLFGREVMEKNIGFYEKRTVHDSSLSRCAHALAYAGLGFPDRAYAFCEKAMEIDLSDNPFDSVDGIHSAALGGVWSCVVCGFAGVSHREGVLTLSPSLPACWKSMKFYLKVQNTYLHIYVSRTEIQIEPEAPPESGIAVEICGRRYELRDSLTVLLPG